MNFFRGAPEGQVLSGSFSKGSGVMLCRVAREGVLGSWTGLWVSLAGTVWQEGGEECCPWSWEKLEGGEYCDLPCG